MPPAVDLIKLANDVTGAWETQVFLGTVAAVVNNVGTFVSFGAIKDGLLPQRFFYKGTDRKTKKRVDVPLRVGAQLHVMVTRIRLAKKLCDTRVSLKLAPQCRQCKKFGHIASSCRRTVVSAPVVCLPVQKPAVKPLKAVHSELKSKQFSVAFQGDLSKIAAKAAPAAKATKDTPAAPSTAAPKPVLAKPWAKVCALEPATEVVCASEPANSCPEPEQATQPEPEPPKQSEQPTRLSKSQRRRLRAKKVRAALSAEKENACTPQKQQPAKAVLAKAPVAAPTLAAPAPLTRCSTAESKFNSMMAALDEMIAA